jgi:hypothetical protein
MSLRVGHSEFAHLGVRAVQMSDASTASAGARRLFGLKSGHPLSGQILCFDAPPCAPGAIGIIASAVILLNQYIVTEQLW